MSQWFEKCKEAGFRCWMCGREFPFGRLTRDHIIPRSRGGHSRLSNLKPACKPCNGGRGAPEVYPVCPSKRFSNWWET